MLKNKIINGYLPSSSLADSFASFYREKVFKLCLSWLTFPPHYTHTVTFSINCIFWYIQLSDPFWPSKETSDSDPIPTSVLQNVLQSLLRLSQTLSFYLSPCSCLKSCQF